MAKLTIPSGTTSKRITVFLQDSSSTTGAGLTGLAFNTSNLVCYSWIDTDGNAGGTSQTLATATLGTWTSIGFKEKDATNLPGFYEFGVPNALIAAGVKWAVIMFKGATNLAPCPIEIEVTATSNQDSVRGGMTALPNVAAAGAGGLMILGSNNTAAITVGALTTGAVTITASGDALTISSSGGNGNGINVAGNGSGSGVLSTGGATGHGLKLLGGATSGDGLNAAAATSGHGLTATGIGTTKHGINATGGATTSAGILATGGATSGDGIKAVAATSGIGLNLLGAGTTKPGLLATGGGTTSAGISVVGGSTSGDGILVATTSGHGVNLAPVGSSKHGIFATGGDSGTSDGVKAVAGSGGVPIRGDITGNITGALSGAVGSVTGAVGSVTGNVGGSVASVVGAVGSVTGAVGSVTGAVGSVTGNVGGNVVGSVASVVAAVAITSNVKTNQALTLFQFLMTDSTNHAPATGLTVTCTRSIDGGAFGAGTLANVTELANGIYGVDFGAGDLNGKVIILKATATGADARFERLVTQP